MATVTGAGGLATSDSWPATPIAGSVAIGPGT